MPFSRGWCFAFGLFRESDGFESAAEEVEDQEDEYEPTPAKPRPKGRGAAGAAAKAAATKPAAPKRAAGGSKNKVRKCIFDWAARPV